MPSRHVACRVQVVCKCSCACFAPVSGAAHPGWLLQAQTCASLYSKDPQQPAQCSPAPSPVLVRPWFALSPFITGSACALLLNACLEQGDFLFSSQVLSPVSVVCVLLVYVRSRTAVCVSGQHGVHALWLPAAAIGREKAFGRRVGGCAGNLVSLWSQQADLRWGR